MTETETEDVTEETPQEVIEKAFLDSENHSLNGTKLQPYSPARKVAAQAMGLYYGTVDDADAERFRSDKIYPMAQRDTIIVIWLCTLADEDQVDDAARAPKPAYKRARAWADGEGLINMKGAKFWEAYSLFHRIMREVTDSNVRAEKKSGPEKNQNLPIPT